MNDLVRRNHHSAIFRPPYTGRWRKGDPAFAEGFGVDYAGQGHYIAARVVVVDEWTLPQKVVKVRVGEQVLEISVHSLFPVEIKAAALLGGGST